MFACFPLFQFFILYLGVVYFDDKIIPGSNIIELLPNTFYAVNYKKVAKFQEWKNLLCEVGLKSYIKNSKEEHEVGVENPWFFLGKLTT